MSEEKKESTPEEAGHTFAMLMAAAFLKAADSLDNDGMLKVGIDVVHQMEQHGTKADMSVFVHTAVQGVKALLAASPEGRKARFDAAFMARQAALDVVEEGVSLGSEVAGVINLGEVQPEGGLFERMRKAPELRDEMHAYDDAADILLRDCKSGISQAAQAVDTHKEMVRQREIVKDHINRTGCPCGNCPPPEETEAEPVH